MASSLGNTSSLPLCPISSRSTSCNHSNGLRIIAGDDFLHIPPHGWVGPPQGNITKNKVYVTGAVSMR
jgi:hypothetical protein